MTFLTIGLPVYNSMPFLPEALQSLLRQSYEDFTLLAIDDGSNDGSLEYVRSVRDRRIRLLSQSHLGLSATLNRMLREASTPWLVRHDADDIAYPDRLALTADHITRFPDTGMFYSPARYYQDGKIFGTFRSTIGSSEELRRLTRSGFLLAICHPTVTLNIEKTLAVGGYRFDLHLEDLDLWWRMALHYPIRLIPALTVAVRHNVNSVSVKHFEQQRKNILFVQYLLLSHLWQRSPLPYELAIRQLTPLVDRQAIRAQEHTRLSICFGRKRYLAALKHACLALVASPSYVMNRAWYELRPNALVTNGISPNRFIELEDLLWPTH